MDFDEYEYLEKTVEPADLVKGSNGSGTKSRSTDRRRSGEEGNDAEDGYRSKRHRSGDGERERYERPADDHNLERSRREKSRDHDRDRDRDRDRERSERSHRDRGHRDSDRDHRDGERRRKDSDRDRDYDRDYDREVERPRRKEPSQSGSKDYERYDRESSRTRNPEREHRYARERKERKEESAPEPEADPERDQRTVFAFQISLKADERDVYDFFSRAGKVRDVRLIMDRNTRRSKGVGYIEFYDAMSVPMAIALTGQLLLGQPVMVKPSEAEKNLVQSTSTTTTGAGAMGPYSGSARRLYVGNLHFNIGEEQLRQVFDPFGAIELVQLPLDSETGLGKGFGFVQYARLEDARAAQAALNGTLELAGRVIKVVPMTDQNSGADSVVAPGELDDDDGGGLSLTARSRALLMQKLDRSGTVQTIVSTTGQSLPPAFNMVSAVTTPTIAPLAPSIPLPGMIGLQTAGLGTLGTGVAEPIGVPTDCLLLKNMFDPSTETDPDFDLDIKEEVQSECSKYGVVKHIYVDKNSAGFVFLRFSSLTAAVNAQRSLHGRWFAGKMITTIYMTPQAYEAKFPDSR